MNTNPNILKRTATMAAESRKEKAMKNIALACLFVLMLMFCGCHFTEEDTLQEFRSFQCNEWPAIKAVAVETEETLPQTNMVRTIVRLDNKILMTVLAPKKLDKGQHLELVRVTYQSTEQIFREYYVVVIPKE